MKVEDFLKKIAKKAQDVAFADTMSVVEANYVFTPTAFKNGTTNNEVGQNSGSCKLFAFAKMNKLTKQQTLYCFGEYYRNDVLKNPEGTDHQNIRNFIKYAWEGVIFEAEALVSNTQD